MTDNLKKILEAARGDRNLFAQLETLKELGDDQKAIVERAMEIAKEYGIELKPEDFEEAESQLLSDDELDAIAAAGACTCVLAGGGSTPGNPDASCSCLILGTGGIGPRYRCECQAGGTGQD